MAQEEADAHLNDLTTAVIGDTGEEHIGALERSGGASYTTFNAEFLDDI